MQDSLELAFIDTSLNEFYPKIQAKVSVDVLTILLFGKNHVGKAFVRLLSNLTSSHHLPMATSYV